MDNQLVENVDITATFDNIRSLVISSRNRVYSTVSTEMLNLYWSIGKAIMEVQNGDERASYGGAILDKLSKRLTAESSKLNWSHYLELIKIEEDPKRNFYLNECINTRWSVRELERQISSLLYEKLSLCGRQ